jgi:glycerol-3-phosphate O-acyltransferase / dihydroxyacetone phosphate acyltransferase
MLYNFFKPLAAFALKGFFKKIELSGLHNIPKGQPVILAANHPTAFVEPCILAAYLDRPLYFLVRGDYFRKPVYRFILQTLHMLPIFRRMDGNFTDLKNNVKTLEACSDALAQNKTIMILAEGRTKHEKRLRPIQKGTARLAFTTLFKYPGLDLSIVPVSVNFTNSLKWRSHVMIHFGSPIHVKPFFEHFSDNTVGATNHLTQKLQTEIRKKVIHIDRKKDDKTADKLLIITRNHLHSNGFSSLDGELMTIDHWNKLNEDENKTVKTALKTYFKILKSKHLDDKYVSENAHLSAIHYIKLCLGFIPAIPGVILNLIPVLVSKWIIHRRVSRKTYQTAVFIASIIGTHLLLFIITSLIAAITSLYFLIFIQPLAILTGLFTVFYWDIFNDFLKYITWKTLSNEQKNLLIKQKNTILSTFNLV